MLRDDVDKRCDNMRQTAFRVPVTGRQTTARKGAAATQRTAKKAGVAVGAVAVGWYRVCSDYTVSVPALRHSHEQTLCYTDSILPTAFSWYSL